METKNSWMKIVDKIINIVLLLGVVPFFIVCAFFGLSGYGNIWWVIGLLLIIPIGYVVWSFICLANTINKDEENQKKVVSAWLLGGSSVLLLAGIYFVLIGMLARWNPYIYLVPAVLFLTFKVVALFFDFLAQAELFVGVGYETCLLIVLVAIYVLSSVNSKYPIVVLLGKIIAIVFSLVFTALVLKSCLLDRLSLNNHNAIIKFLIIVGVSVAISIYTLYLWFWDSGASDQSLFSAIMGIYAAVLGGAITLGGVAWTIRRQDEIKKEEEKKKAKPLFSFIMLKNPILDINGQRVCFDDEGFARFEKNVIGIIENSEKSAFSIEKVYHDNKWWNIVGNKVVLPNKSVYIDFNFTKEDWLFFIEVEDALQNKFYYKIDVLTLNYVNLENSDMHPHKFTVRDIKEISLEKMQDMINKNQKEK